jgi:cytochrome c-type biogenesis protein CcmH/NrfG
MKKETILFVVIALLVGLLVGVIFTNARKDSPATSTAQSPAMTPAVNYQQQIKMLQDVVNKEPGNRNAWVQLGHNYFDSDQPMLAVDAYDKALAIDDNDANVLTDQGVMFRRLGWFDRAVENFEKASRLSPNHQQSVYNLGIVYRSDLQDIPKAIAAWEKFLALNPSGAGAAQVRADLEQLKSLPAARQ